MLQNGDLFRHFGTSIQARHIAIPIEHALRSRTDESLDSAVEKLAPDYWCAPVVGEHERIVGVFDRRAAASARCVGDAMRPLDSGLLVSSDTSLIDLAQHLAEESFLLVVHGRAIAGFVTPSDMGSPAARTYFYVLLADLEVSLAELVRFVHADEGSQRSAIAALGERQWSAYLRHEEDQKARDTFQDPVAVLSLSALLRVASRTEFRPWLKDRHGVGWAGLTGGMTPFRNDVMHPVRALAWATQENMASMSRKVNQVEMLGDAAREFVREVSPLR